MESRETELPECPVCLQVYCAGDTVPRVLACGHSVCEGCLAQLPHRFANTVRCPACNQLVTYPTHQGASALPKNIDLLSFITQQNPNPNPSSVKEYKNSVSQCEFLPRSWSDDFYSEWKEWIVPKDAILIQRRGEESFCSVFEGRVSSSGCSSVSGRSCFVDNQVVSLVQVFSCFLDRSLFNPSYVVSVTEALSRVGERKRGELCLMLRGSLRQSRVCNVYGLWMDLEDGCLYMACERLKDDFVKKSVELWKGISGGTGEGLIENGKGNLEMKRRISSFASLGMELCEALIGLHSEGMVSGCLALSCFSFDTFGRAFVDLSEILVTGRRVRKCIAEAAEASSIANLLKSQTFVSPELLHKLLHEEGIAPECGSLNHSIGCCSDVWSLACILISLLLQNLFSEEQLESLYCVLPEKQEEKCDERLAFYRHWVETASSMLETSLVADFTSFRQVICRCLDLDPGGRPCVTDVWRCIRELIIEPQVDIMSSLNLAISRENSVQCLTLGNLCTPEEVATESWSQNGHELQGSLSTSDLDQVAEGKGDLIEGLCLGKFKSINLQGHMDCISGLAIGGGFLFSSSFDKTIRMWSLQDFSCVQTFRGHEHRITGVVFVDTNLPLCVSVDIEGGIFVWKVGISNENEPLKKWYEEKEWRFSGIHALAVSETEVLYTGSGDKSIKAWSLQDYNLLYTMNGHKSVVSCLAVCDGVLYSGSWDGTICLWCLNDHSLLTVMGDEKPGNAASVLSLSVDHCTIVAAYENGRIKMWRNDLFSRLIDTQDGTTLALYIKGKWLFMGGWNKTINIQELVEDGLQVETKPIGSVSCNSVVTALLFREGKLFAGFADRVIKVYHFGV